MAPMMLLVLPSRTKKVPMIEVMMLMPAIASGYSIRMVLVSPVK